MCVRCGRVRHHARSVAGAWQIRKCMHICVRIMIEPSTDNTSCMSTSCHKQHIDRPPKRCPRVINEHSVHFNLMLRRLWLELTHASAACGRGGHPHADTLRVETGQSPSPDTHTLTHSPLTVCLIGCSTRTTDLAVVGDAQSVEAITSPAASTCFSAWSYRRARRSLTSVVCVSKTVP